MKTRAPLALVLLASLAFAATAFTYRHNVLVAGKTMLGTQVETNLISRSAAGSLDFNFAAKTIECEDSWGVGLVGALVGDSCHVGVPAFDTTDAGNGLNHLFDCYVSDAGEVKIRACAVGTADDPPDAGYTFRTFSVQ